MDTPGIGQTSQVGGGVRPQSVDAQTTSSNTPQDFKDLLQMMLPLMAIQGMSSTMGGGSSKSDSPLGFDFNSFMMPAMFNLMEKLMSMELSSQNENEVENSLLENMESIASLESAKTIHINQFDAEKMVGGDGVNSNCGPTSLAIALHALGLRVPGETESSNTGQVVDFARKSMVIDPSRDGIGYDARRSEGEHNTFTNFSDLIHGAKAAGARVSTITPNAKSIREALEGGGVVIISGTFVGKFPLPWTGDLGFDNGSAPGNATAHIVAITGYDTQHSQFIVNDPARRTPLLVSADKLEYFMRGNAGGIVLKN